MDEDGKTVENKRSGEYQEGKSNHTFDHCSPRSTNIIYSRRICYRFLNATECISCDVHRFSRGHLDRKKVARETSPRITKREHSKRSSIREFSRPRPFSFEASILWVPNGLTLSIERDLRFLYTRTLYLQSTIIQILRKRVYEQTVSLSLPSRVRSFFFFFFSTTKESRDQTQSISN